MLAEKKATPFYQFVTHTDLAKKIAEIKKDAGYGEKFDPLILIDSKRDVSELLGEETEVRLVREHLQKKQEHKLERKKL